MLINYGSLMYVAYIAAVLFASFLIYQLIKKCPKGMQHFVIFLISIVNLLQHLFKGVIYPQYQAGYSLHLSTAYNFCALLIILTPIIYLFKNNYLRCFISFAGMMASALSIAFPYWFIGQSAFTWEVYRFYICHALLFLTSSLPLFLGLTKYKFKYFWSMGLMFFLSLGLIVANNVIFLKAGWFTESPSTPIFEFLSAYNPVWLMHPPVGFDWLITIFNFVTPAYFLGANPWNLCIPVLWYAIPAYILITVTYILIYFGAKLFHIFRNYLIDSHVR